MNLEHEEFTKKIKDKVALLGVVFCKAKGL